MPTELYLIRHGESVPNVEPVIGGMRGDAGLTDRGRQQARLLERRLSAERPHVDRLYASTLPRALETAEYVSRALGMSATHDQELHELRPGEADGLTYDQVRARYGGMDDPDLARDPFRALSPGGEGRAEFLLRAGSALARLVRVHRGESIAAVCHGGVVDASFYLAFGLSGTNATVAFAPANTSITHWRHERGPGGRPDWTLVSFNDAKHLDAMDGAAGAAEEASREAAPAPEEGL